MIEYAKMLVEAAVKLIPVGDLLKQRRADRVAELGIRLFDLYGDVIRVAQGGFGILRSLKYAIGRHKYYYESGVPDSTIRAVNTLSEMLKEQSERIGQLTNTFSKLHPVADIAESSSEQANYARLFGLVNSKAYYVLMLGDRLGEVAGLGATWLAVELGHANARLDADDQAEKAESVFTQLDRFELPDVEKEIVNAIFEGRLSLETIPWNIKVNKVADLYIESGLGKKRLDELVDLATKFRSAFQKSFKIEDVLFAAEKRLKDQENP